MTHSFYNLLKEYGGSLSVTLNKEDRRFEFVYTSSSKKSFCFFISEHAYEDGYYLDTEFKVVKTILDTMKEDS